MRDGFIQQIGTPQEVFNHPSNLFVAGFIGTPQMNFFRDVRLNTENGFYSVEIFGRKFRLEERQQEALKVAGCPSGRVAAGVRPQHIRLKQGGIEGRLEVSEMMGSEQHLHINIGGQEVVAIVPTADIRSGIDKVEIDFLPENIHLFDQATEKNLI